MDQFLRLMLLRWRVISLLDCLFVANEFHWWYFYMSIWKRNWFFIKGCRSQRLGIKYMTIDELNRKIFLKSNLNDERKLRLIKNIIRTKKCDVEIDQIFRNSICQLPTTCFWFELLMLTTVLIFGRMVFASIISALADTTAQRETQLASLLAPSQWNRPGPHMTRDSMKSLIMFSCIRSTEWVWFFFWCTEFSSLNQDLRRQGRNDQMERPMPQQTSPPPLHYLHQQSHQ